MLEDSNSKLIKIAMSQNIDELPAGSDYSNCLIQNYPRFSLFYLQK